MDITKRIKTTKQIQNYQAKLKGLIYELFLTEEREKHQLAIDLHDHFSQLLVISKMKISEFARNNKHVENDQTLIDARKYLEEALNKARLTEYYSSGIVRNSSYVGFCL